MKKRMSVSEAARMMGRAGLGDCKRRNVDYRKLARMAVAARRKKALMTGANKNEREGAFLSRITTRVSGPKPAQKGQHDEG